MAKGFVNPSFIGIDDLETLKNVLDVKHFANICEFAKSGSYTSSVSATVNKETGEITHRPIDFIGLDIETSSNPHRIELMGWCDYNPITKKEGYDFVYRNDGGLKAMVEMLAALVKYCAGDKEKNEDPKQIVYWGKFDAINILRMLLEYNGYKEDDVMKACRKVAKGIGGYYKKGWKVSPVVMCTLPDGTEFGISAFINDCIRFFYQSPKMKNRMIPEKKNGIETGNKIPSPIMFEVWGFDGSKHWKGGLEKTVVKELKNTEKFVELKNDESLHVIDWEKFDDEYKARKKGNKSNANYVSKVLNANRYDCYAVKNLTTKVRDNFYKVFGAYPRSMISTGTLTRVALSTMMNKETREKLSIYSNIVEWSKNTQVNDMKLFLNLMIDSYSGGMIEIHTLGSFNKLGFLDINSSFPAVIRGLLDLENSTIKTGGKCSFEEVPKPNGTNYVMMTGNVSVRPNVYHTLTLKAPHLVEDDVYGEEIVTTEFRHNFRPSGNFVASGMYEEFELLESQNRSGKKAVTFVQEWVEIQTEGKISPLGQKIEKMYKQRMEFREKKDEGSENIVKDILNSTYGKTFECIKQHEEFGHNIVFSGHRAGEFFNPVYATIITAFARIRLVEMVLQIRKNKGLPIVLMTDAIYFQVMDEQKEAIDYVPSRFQSILKNYKGLEENGWDNEKVLGLYSKPKTYVNGLFLKTGFYEFQDPETEEYEVKTMGFFLDRKKEESKKPYILRRLQYAAENKTVVESGQYEGEPCIRMTDNVVVSAGDIAEQVHPIELLGAIVPKVVDLTFNDFHWVRNPMKIITPDLLLEGTILTTATNADQFGYVLDARLLDYRKVFTFQSNFQPVRVDWNEQIKILSKQLGIPQNIKKPNRDKALSEGRVWGKYLGVEKMRALLLKQGIEPLA